MNELEPIEKKICRACGVEKQLTRFTKNPNGYKSNVCNLCKSNGNTIDKPSKKHIVIKNHPLRLDHPKITDYEKSYRLLERMGYSLEQDIHKQFCNRYGLIIRSPKQSFLNYYSPKDLGLV